MSLPNTTLWGNIYPGGVPGDLSDGSLDTTQVIDNLLWSLHAASRADLVFWTETDLIQWMDEALKRLARKACVFVGRSVDTLSVSGQATYSLPDRHVSTLHVSYLTTPLRGAGTLEMEARDSAYLTTQGTPDHWYQDLQGATKMGLSPAPSTSDDVIPIIYQGWPETLDAGRQNTLVAAPAPVKGYLSVCLLAEAYGREGEMESQDIAAHCRGRRDLYEQAFASYYGSGI